VIAAPDHPLAQLETVDLTDLAGARMISMPASIPAR